MSELITMRPRADLRLQLLATASALTLMAVVASQAKAEDADRPTVWIELGGQMESLSGQGSVFAPGFLARNPDSSVLQSVTPQQAQKLPSLNFDEEMKIAIEPEGSDWVFAANLRYGRSSTSREVDHQTNRVIHGYNFSGSALLFTNADFADTHARRQQSRAILDFSAGKDVGLGLFGNKDSSVFSLGVRIAQFASKETFDIRARPDLNVKYYPSAHSTPARFPLKYFHTYHATGYASRSFHGVGPSLSWAGSMPIVGDVQSGQINIDWGANASVLFGKQKAHVRHQEAAHYHSKLAGADSLSPSAYALVYHYSSRGHDTDRAIAVPNVGGFAGVSWRVQDFKVSLGYRADFFFGAMDTGIDARKSETVGFYGPFAKISIGLGG